MNTLRIFLLLVLCSGTVFSQGSNTYDLEQCIKIALENNPDVIGSKSEIRARDAELTSAFGDYLPQITASSSYRRQLNNVQTYTNQAGFTFVNSPDSYSIGVNASLDIFNGFYREANYTRVQKSLEAAEYNIIQTEEEIVRDVYRNYITVIRNFQVVQTRKENLELGKKELEKISAQFEAGITPVSTVYTQEAEVGQREIDLINAENEFYKSKAVLLMVMGLNPLAEVEFMESSIPNRISKDLIDKFRQETGTMNSAVTQAMENRYDIKSAEASLEIAESSIKMAGSAYMPTLTASGGWNWGHTELNNFDDFGNYSIGVSLFVPIFTNFNPNYQIQNAKVNLEQRELDHFRLEQAIRNEIKSVFLNLQAAEKQIEITEKSLRAAQQSYDSMNERFDLGAANITDIFLANNQLINAKINRINAVYSYYLAQKEILYSIGKIK